MPITETYRHFGMTVNRLGGVSAYRVFGSIVLMLGDRIEERRLTLGISQAELGRRARVPQTTMNGIIRDSPRTTPHLIRIANALLTTPAYLTGETDDPEAEAPAGLVLTEVERNLVEAFRSLSRRHQEAISTIVTAMRAGDAPDRVSATGAT